MIFKTSELRDFINKSRAITTNNVLPVLSYIKYDNGVLTKTNLGTYFSSEISTKDNSSFLLDEKIISAILKDISSSEINIEPNGKFVTVNGKTKFPMEDIVGFPKAPKLEDDKKEMIDTPIIEALGYFKLLTMATEHTHNLSFVHLTKGGMFASNNNSFVNRSFVADIPEILLNKEACSMLQGYSEVEFYRTANYNFFVSGKDTIAFIKPEQRTPVEAFDRVLSGGNKEQYIEFEKSHIVSFCDFVGGASPALLPDCYMSVANRKMTLTLNDSQYEITDSREFDVIGGFEIEKLSFNPKIFSLYLKAIPYNLIRFSPHSQTGVLSIWTIEDEQFSGVLVGLS